MDQELSPIREIRASLRRLNLFTIGRTSLPQSVRNFLLLAITERISFYITLTTCKVS